MRALRPLLGIALGGGGSERPGPELRTPVQTSGAFAGEERVMKCSRWVWGGAQRPHREEEVEGAAGAVGHGGRCNLKEVKRI